MAKTPKLKKRPVSLRSRAARRGTSPSIDTDKTLKAVEPPVETVQLQTNVLGLRNGGITKKKTQKPMSRQQRLRQQKALERADRNIDKLDRKVATSVQKEKRVKARRANWDDLDRALSKQTKPTGPRKTTHEPLLDPPSANDEGAAGRKVIAIPEDQQPAAEESAPHAGQNNGEAAEREIL